MALQPSLGAWVTLAGLVTYISVASGLSCAGVDGPVDWFVALKAAGQLRTPGTDYAYLDRSEEYFGVLLACVVTQEASPMCTGLIPGSCASITQSAEPD